jgi:two-component system KDP operon response regulator KdpE
MARGEPAPVVLVVEDESDIRRFVRTSLESEGWHVFEAGTVASGLVEAGTRKPDVVILDLGLPDGDGVSFIHEVRKWSELPILILSARAEEQNKIAALDAGADDYLTKPFGVGELLARVRALLRRRVKGSGLDTSVVAFGDIRVDLNRRIVERAGNQVHLTPIEYRLLSVLLTHPGKVLTQRLLLREVWGPSHGPSHAEQSHYLRIYMGHLRQKLETDPTQPVHFVTEPGVGYRFAPAERD